MIKLFFRVSNQFFFLHILDFLRRKRRTYFAFVKFSKISITAVFSHFSPGQRVKFCNIFFLNFQHKIFTIFHIIRASVCNKESCIFCLVIFFRRVNFCAKTKNFFDILGAGGRKTWTFAYHCKCHDWYIFAIFFHEAAQWKFFQRIVRCIMKRVKFLQENFEYI